LWSVGSPLLVGCIAPWWRNNLIEYSRFVTAGVGWSASLPPSDPRRWRILASEQIIDPTAQGDGDLLKTRQLDLGATLLIVIIVPLVTPMASADFAKDHIRCRRIAARRRPMAGLITRMDSPSLLGTSSGWRLSPTPASRWPLAMMWLKSVCVR